jgi:ribosomal protein S18 acetylase RimI-like enzyme
VVIDIFLVAPTDLHRVRDLALVIWPDHYTPLIGADLVAGIVAHIYSMPSLYADMHERRQSYWIITTDGKDAGYASAYVQGGTLWIKKLYLLPETRGLGLGKLLIETVRNYFGIGYPQALFVAEKNQSAIDFYRSQGFFIERLEPVMMGPHQFHDYLMIRAGSPDAAGK